MAKSNNKELGWMSINYHDQDYFSYSDRELYMDDLSKIYSETELNFMQKLHPKMLTIEGLRQIHHWLDLKNCIDSIDDFTIVKKEILLKLFENEIFNPFIDISKSIRLIKNSYLNNKIIWIIRLSTTIPGALTISCPKKVSIYDEIFYKTVHFRFRLTKDGKYKHNNIEYSLDELINCFNNKTCQIATELNHKHELLSYK